MERIRMGPFFCIFKRASARKGHNPRTGEAIEIAAATIPVFKPGKALKDKVDAK